MDFPEIPKDKWRGYMIYAYILENNSVLCRNNQPLFLLINEMDVADDYCYFDIDGYERLELYRLLIEIPADSKLIIRSAEDLADDMDELEEIFILLSEKNISLCSCKEPFLSGTDYIEMLKSMQAFFFSFQNKKKKKAYQKAVTDGKVGRPAKTKNVENAIKLYESRIYTIAQIEALTGVSKSTLYKYLNKKGDAYGI